MNVFEWIENKSCAEISSISIAYVFCLLIFLFITLWFKNNNIPKKRRKYYKGVAELWSLWFVSDIVWSSSTSNEINPIDFLAILGTLLAVIAWGEASEQNREVEKIEKSLPTRHIDSFPNHLNDIIELITKTQDNFHILADCVDYGSFSNLEDYEKVIQAIMKIHHDNASRTRKVKIEIRVCGVPQAISRSSEFRKSWDSSEYDGEKWDKLCKARKFRRRLKFFYQRNQNRLLPTFNPNKFSRKEFNEMMLDFHTKEEVRLKDEFGVFVETYMHLKHMPGLFFWMKDDVEAVFLLSHTGAGTQGMAFYTRDARILDILNKTWENVKTEGKSGQKLIADFKAIPNKQNFLKLFPSEKHPLIEAFLKMQKTSN